MIDAKPENDNRLRHFFALAASVLVLIFIYSFPSGVFGYLLALIAAGVAVYIGHRAIQYRGKFKWAAIVGLVLSYYLLLFSASLLVVRVV